MTVVNGSRNAPLSPPVSDDLSEPCAGTAPGWIHHLPEDSRIALAALGHLLTGAERESPRENGIQFCERILGLPREARLVSEALGLDGLTRVTMGLAVSAVLAEHEDASFGPFDGTAAPSWTTIELTKGTDLRIPHALSAGFPTGTLHPEVPAVIRVNTRGGLHGPEIDVTVRPEHRADAREILGDLRTRAEALNPYRGRWVTVSVGLGGGGAKLSFAVQEPPAVTRDDVVAPAEVWEALDAAAAAVSTRRPELEASGLPIRHGVLIAGPPGNGKTLSGRLVAAELLASHGFTVMQVEAKAGDALGAIMEQAVTLAPAVVLLDDVDLLGIGDRTIASSRGLHEVLSAMDMHQDAAVLTVATANTLKGLDAAAIRPGRFASLITVSNPGREEAESLLRTYLRAVPGGDDVDVSAVSAMLPTGSSAVSGAHIREAVRRAVLLGTPVSTVSLGNVIRSNGWRPEPKHGGGQYL